MKNKLLCVVCEMTVPEAGEVYPEDGPQLIKTKLFDKDYEFWLCPHCAHLSWYKMLIKCKECGTVTEMPRNWAIYERFAQKIGIDEVAIQLSRQDFMSMNLILFMDGCPSCKAAVRGAEGRG